MQDLLITQTEEIINTYREERQKYYEDKLYSLRNVTVLEEHRSGMWEHALINPIYQDILQKIIYRYGQGEYQSYQKQLKIN